ncbi:MAG: hypothetical protein KC657_23320 [Myxococcales bacterium]|nr:hypothetical protein [Myxococcales bacterium]
MRSKAVSIALVVMMVALVGMLVSRNREKHDAPAEEVTAAVSPGDDGGADAAAAGDAGPHLATTDAAAPAGGMRVVGLGWELLAPAVTASGDPGPDEIAAAYALEGVETRLARGVADPAGADVAIMPLASFIVSYDRLKALDARAFLVVGFSAGREELHAVAPSALVKAPGTEDVTLVAAPASAGSEAATLLGLFALDAIGTPASRLKLIPATAPEAKGAPFAATLRGAPDDRKRVLSTADAPRLVPIVAVAPASALDASAAKYAAWAKRWLEGLARSKADAATVARRLAAKEGARISSDSGSPPEALALVERLGQIEAASLETNASLARDGAEPSLSGLARETWRLARAGGLVAGAAPESPPVSTKVVTMLAPESADAGTSAPPADAAASSDASLDGPAPLALATLDAASTPILVARLDPAAETDAITARVALLAHVFDRATLAVSVKGNDKATREVLARAAARGVPAGRLAVGRLGAPATTIEVHAPR